MAEKRREGSTPREPRPRGGAPVLASSGPRERVLRIAILLGDASRGTNPLVEERTLRERVPVSIGQSMKNTFSIPVDGLPLEHTLFSLEDGRYHLRFLAKMDGRVSDGGQPQTLEQLKASGATKHGDVWSVPLRDSSRGKVSLGDLTILFQLVPMPPRQPRPMLPASVRGTFADRFDPRLSVILGASIIAHFAIVIIALVTDPEVPNTMADRAYSMTFTQDTVDLKEPDKPKPVDDKNGEVTKKADAPKTAEKKADKAPDKAPPKAEPDQGRHVVDQVAMQEDATKLANLLTAQGDNGTTQGNMDSLQTAANLKQQIDAIKDGGGHVAMGDSSGRGSRGNGSARVGTGTGPQVDGPSGVASADGGKSLEKGPSGRIAIAEKKALDESSLTPDLVLNKIMAAYMAGLKRCYKQYLNKDGSARGKVTLAFGVNETGRTVNGSAHGFAGEVDQCISAQMGSWHFPSPKDKDGEATEANFSITLQLVPD